MDEKRSDKVLKIEEPVKNYQGQRVQEQKPYDETESDKEIPDPRVRTRKGILKKGTSFRTRGMIPEDEERELFLATTVTGIILQLIYLITGGIYVLNLFTPNMYYLNSALTYELTERSFLDNAGNQIYFQEIDKVTQIFSFILNRFLPSMYLAQVHSDESPIQDNDHMFCNFLIGAVRLRQLRIRDNTCPVWEKLASVRKTCISEYKEEFVDESDFGPMTSNAWKYHKPEVTRVPHISLALATYSGGGHLIDLPKDRGDAEWIVENLKHNIWIDRQTRVVFLETILYNTNVNLFATINVAFELPPTGLLTPSIIIHPVDLTDTYSASFIFVKIIYTILNLIYMIKCVREALHFKKACLTMFWNYVDLFIMVFSAIALYLDINARYRIIPTQLAQARQAPEMYGHLEKARVQTKLCKELVGLSVFLVYIRTFQYMNFSKTTNQLNRVIRKSSFNIMMFVIVFLIIFLAYAASGTLIFGDVSEDFGNIGLSMFSLVRMMFAKIDYNTIAESRSLMGQIFILSYIMMIIFILMNIFLSILNCTYAEVRTELGSKTNQLQITDYISIRLRRALKTMGVKFKGKQLKKQVTNVEEGKIRSMLLDCGFKNLEIEMFFARYNIDPSAEVGATDIEELKEVAKRQSLSKGGNVQMHSELEGIQLDRKEFQREVEKILEMKYLVQLLHERMNDLVKAVEKATRESI